MRRDAAPPDPFPTFHGTRRRKAYLRQLKKVHHEPTLPLNAPDIDKFIRDGPSGLYLPASYSPTGLNIYFGSEVTSVEMCKTQWRYTSYLNHIPKNGETTFEICIPKPLKAFGNLKKDLQSLLSLDDEVWKFVLIGYKKQAWWLRYE